MKAPILALAIALAAPVFAHDGHDAKPSYAAALADSARPDADKARDAARKPAELLAFAGVKPGQVVVDYIMGGGYLTRILSAAVGPTGKVYAYQPAEFIGFRAQYGTDQDTVAAAYKNIVPLRTGVAAFKPDQPVDTIITVQNWHDLHLKAAPPGTGAALAKGLFAALKPGGTMIVVDHAAAAGSADRDSDTLHRIDPALVRREFEGAGFKFDGELKTWANPPIPTP